MSEKHRNRWLVGIREAEEYTGLPTWKLYQWREHGLITPWRRGKRIMFDLREIPEKNAPNKDHWPQRLPVTGHAS